MLWGLVCKEISVCFSQFFYWKSPFFSLFRALKFFALSLIRLLLGRSTKFSFAYTGEDRVIEGLLKPRIQQKGFYVDVGCNHPVFLSNTFGLYRKGWRGVCIDANPEQIKKHQQVRPKDQAICALVSDKNTREVFFEMKNNVLSSADESYVLRCLKDEKQQQVVRKFEMTSQTLTQILDRLQVPQYFDLLSIDIEEWDFYALQSLDFERYSPKLIVLEAEDFDLLHAGAHPVTVFLRPKGYQLVGAILSNIYFMK